MTRHHVHWDCARPLLIASLLFGGLVPAGAAGAGAKDACAASANETALLACRQSQLDRSDIELKATMRQLDRSSRQEGPGLAKALSTAHAAWLKYRDAECRVRTYESRDGSAFKVYWLACMNDLNLARLHDLQLMKDQP